MPASGIVYLMYHELELPDRPLCRPGEGYARYVVSLENFRKQLTQLQASGFRGLSVSEGLARNEITTNTKPSVGAELSPRCVCDQQPAVVITFDDGCETDWITAAPLFAQSNFRATFYLVSAFLGQPGYLSPTQVRELDAAGFEVGCHSMTHAYLPDLSTQALRAELAESKERLEQLIGRPVNHFSCPGGRWSPRVAEQARELGYLSVSTSRIGLNTSRSDPFRLARVGIMRDTGLDQFNQLCRGDRFLLLQTREAALAAAKKFLGNPLYEKVRSLLLDRR